MEDKEYIAEPIEEGMKLAISKEIFSKYPSLRIGVIVAKNINNHRASDLPKISIPALTSSKVQAWNKIYSSFGIDPKKNKPSIVNLIELYQKKTIKINKIVDVYNHISLKHIVPAGGSDLDKIKGNIYLRVSKDKAEFIPLNTMQKEYTKPGEIVYSDEEKIITRSWNYKESNLTKFTESTKNAILELEFVDPFTDAEISAAVSDLASLIKSQCGGEVNYKILSKNRPTLDINTLTASDKYFEYVEKKQEVQKPTRTLSGFEKKVVDSLSITNLDKNEIASLLEVPPSPELGDLAFPCFILSKTLHKAPNVIAEELAKKIKGAKAVGAYVNFFSDKEALAKQTIESILKGTKPVKKNKTILIEHTSTNPTGPTHIGRIRNSFIGDTLVRLYKAIGYKVSTHYYVNDMGKQVATINWGIHHKIKQDNKLIHSYKKYITHPDFKIMFVYVPANKLAKEDSSVMQEIDEYLVEAEHNKKYLAELKKTANTCLTGQKKTLARYGIKFDKFDFESDLVKANKHRKFIDQMMNMSEHIELEDGTQALDLSQHGFERRGGGTAFLRANGASVYITRDIAYHEYKLSLADKNIIVLGEDHKVEAAELKKLLEILKVPKANNLEAVFLSFVNFDDAKISTRSGTTIPADAVLDEGIEKVLAKKKMNIKIAEKIASGAIRYFELKVSPSKSITFNWDEALSLEGNTGPYLQYALVRAKKVIKNAGKALEHIDYSLLSMPQEIALIKQLALLPEVVQEAAEQYAPQKVANYAFELAQLFSTFYEACQVAKAEPELKAARLALVKAFAIVLKNSLNLLGIEEVSEM